MPCSIAILTWRHSCFVLKELTKERGIGEVQILCDLPYWLVAVLQLQFGLLNNVTVNPLHYGLAAGLTDDGAKIVGCQTKMVGIEGDGVFAGSIFIDEGGEAM